MCVLYSLNYNVHIILFCAFALHCGCRVFYFGCETLVWPSHQLMISLPGAEDGYFLHPGLPWSMSDNSFFFLTFRLTLELRFQVEADSRLACRRGRIAWVLIPGKWWTFGGRREQPRCHGPVSWPHSWALMRHQQHQLSELPRPETLASLPLSMTRGAGP